jgi:small subunit ribosomal protein S6
MKKYEAMIVLDTKGKDESIDSLIKTVSTEIEKAGGKLDQIDQIGKRKFPYSPRHVESGYFVNFFFQAAPAALDALRARLQLNDSVYQQYYQVVRA